MRTLVGTILGLMVLGTLALQEVEAVNIRVREVRRERRAEGLSIVYELHNASVDRWDLHRIEVHLFDTLDRRLELLRPTSPLRRLEREDVEFIRVLIPPMTVQDAQRLEIRIFVEEVKRFPVADPVPTRLVYAFPLRPKTVPAVLQSKTATLRVEPAGVVLSSEHHRAILLRLINQGRKPVSDLVLFGEIRTHDGQRRPFQLPLTPHILLPGGEAYVTVPLPQPSVNRVEEISLQAFYRKAGPYTAVRYSEQMRIRPEGPGAKGGTALRVVGTASR